MAGSLTPAAEKLETVDARIVTGEITSITKDSVVINVAGKGQTLARRDVSEMVFGQGADAMTRLGKAVVVSALGDRICAETLTLASGKFAIVSPSLGRVSMPLSKAAAVYLPSTGSSPAAVKRRCLEMKFAAGKQDMLVVAKKDDAWLGIGGLLKAVTDKDVIFNWKDEDKATERKGVRAILLAQVTTRPASHGGTLVVSDGSRVMFTSATLSAGKLSLAVPSLGDVAIDRKVIASIRFVSERVTNLADMKPAEVKQYGFFDKGFPYRLNRSVGGGPLRLGGRVYGTGLGLHSYARLTYKLDGTFTSFVAVVGIDDSVRPNGDARLVFLGDGKELIPKLRLTGKDKPQTVRMNLKGVRQFTIQVGRKSGYFSAAVGCSFSKKADFFFSIFGAQIRTLSIRPESSNEPKPT